MPRQVKVSVGAPYVYTNRNYLWELTVSDMFRVMEHLTDQEQMLVCMFLNEDWMRAMLEAQRQQRRWIQQ